MPSERAEQRDAVTAPAMVGPHEQVLEVDAGPAEERREVVEEKAKPTAAPSSVSAISTSAYGRGPKRWSASSSTSSTTSWARCSYAASSPMSATIVRRSDGTAGRITDDLGSGVGTGTVSTVRRRLS